MKSIAVLLIVVAGLSACKAPAKQSTRLSQVNDLLGRIERVHVECQMSQESMRAALTKLHVLARPGFDGDAVAAYGEFVQAYNESELREQELRRTNEEMKASADPFFQKWLREQQAYTNPEMRLRSRARLTETRERFEAIVAAVEPALSDYHLVNMSLRDHALFLGNDFNPAAVEGILDQVQVLTQQATQLDARFEECLGATREYVEATALPATEGETLEAEEPTESEETAVEDEPVPVQ